MHPAIQITSDFDVQYPTASATATACAMNLVFTADLLQKRIATLLQPLHLTPTSGLVLGILANAESPLPPNEIADRLIISRATVTGFARLARTPGVYPPTAPPLGPTDDSGGNHRHGAAGRERLSSDRSSAGEGMVWGAG